MTDVTVNPQHPNVASSAAPLLLGSLFNFLLYGVLLIQIYIFHISFPREPIMSKIVVYTIFALENFQTIVVGHDAYSFFAAGFGDVDNLDRVHLQWLGVPIISGIVSGVVQLYYAYRISVFSDSMLLPVGVALLSLLQASSAIAEGVRVYQIGIFTELASQTSVTCTVWLAGSALCDIIIAGSMALVLVQNDTGLPRTHHTITRLVQLIIGTGALTAFATTVDLVLFLSLPHKAYHAAVAVTLAKLYSNSMMVIQNSRVKIVGARNRSPRSTFDLDVDATHIRFAANTTTASSVDGTPGETWVEADAVRMSDSELNSRDEEFYDEPVKKSHDLTGEE